VTIDNATFGGHRNDVRYLPVGRFYLNADTGLVRAWRVQWEQQSDFVGSEGKQVSAGDGRAGGVVDKAVRTAKLMLRFLRSRWFRGHKELVLPLRGDLAIERLSGAVKLLDLDARRVYTYMAYDGSRDKLAERIGAAREVAAWPFAPGFEGADLEQGWLAEEYIPGEHPTGFQGCRDRFDDYYLPLLVAFLQAEAPTVAPFADYVARLRDDILAPDGLLVRVEPGLRQEIEDFVAELFGRLSGTERFAHGTIALALSHGDFFSGNVILTPEGRPRAIDWATTGTRSPLYDLYYLLMNHCVRVMSPQERLERLEIMLAALRRRLGEAMPRALEAFNQSLTGAPELRWLFYLECVHVPLMHCDDPDDRYIRSLATRLSWFKEFELATRGSDGMVPPPGAGVAAAVASEGERHA